MVIRPGNFGWFAALALLMAPALTAGAAILKGTALCENGQRIDIWIQELNGRPQKIRLHYTSLFIPPVGPERIPRDAPSGYVTSNVSFNGEMGYMESEGINALEFLGTGFQFSHFLPRPAKASSGLAKLVRRDHWSYQDDGHATSFHPYDTSHPTVLVGTSLDPSEFGLNTVDQRNLSVRYVILPHARGQMVWDLEAAYTDDPFILGIHKIHLDLRQKSPRRWKALIQSQHDFRSLTGVSSHVIVGASGLVRGR